VEVDVETALRRRARPEDFQLEEVLCACTRRRSERTDGERNRSE
jgi:hypothetical protein